MLLDTPVCDFGWKAPDFTLSDPDGNRFTMSEHLRDKGLLIAFICNHCPYVQRIADDLAADAAECVARAGEQQAIGRVLAVLDHPIVRLLREAHDVGRLVVDEDTAGDVRAVHVGE